jgi:hypothetical protein
MMKKRKFGAGGPAARPMPTPADRAAARKQDEMLKKATVSEKDAAAIASGNRMSKKNAEDMKAVKKYAKGGKVRRYADGDLVMGDAASDTSGLSLGMPSIDTDLRRALTDKELMDANLAAVRAREAASRAKPKPRAAAPTKKAEAPVKKAEAPTKKAETPTKKPASGMRVGSESARAAKTGLREGLRRGARALGDIFTSPFRAAANPGRDYAKGGSVTRADGCAVRGKTKGKMV